MSEAGLSLRLFGLPGLASLQQLLVLTSEGYNHGSPLKISFAYSRYESALPCHPPPQLRFASSTPSQRFIFYMGISAAIPQQQRLFWPICQDTLLI